MKMISRACWRRRRRRRRIVVVEERQEDGNCEVPKKEGEEDKTATGRQARRCICN
jgi:hypothetical protein